MNKYIETDISDGIKQLKVGLSNLLNEITSGNTDTYVLRNIDISATLIEAFLWRYIEDTYSSYWQNGVCYISIKGMTITMEQDDKDETITFKKQKK